MGIEITRNRNWKREAELDIGQYMDSVKKFAGLSEIYFYSNGTVDFQLKLQNNWRSCTGGMPGLRICDLRRNF